MNQIDNTFNKINILLIEDSVSDARILQNQLSKLFMDGYSIKNEQTLEGGLKQLAQEKFSVVLLDRSLPDVDGFEGLVSLQNMAPDLPIVFLTSDKNRNSGLEAIVQGAQDYLIKDNCDGNTIKRAIEFAILRKKYEAILIERANFDLLTGLANRRLFDNRVKLAISRSEREHSFFAVAFLDLDKFKPINDQYGHSAGDLVLKSVGMRLKHAIREYDIAARLGGDEFAILFERIERLDDATIIAKKMLHLFDKPINFQGIALQVCVSIGIHICVDTKGISAERLCAQADELMYEAKKIPGSSYCI